ncbi:MAG: ATP-binding protein [Chloroflexi bacterium]|nr:ATP-binding protein [Chloroflexota bacterium]
MTLRRQLAVIVRLPFPIRPTIVDVESILTDLGALYQQAHSIQLECVLPLYPVVANPLFLTEVFDHILSNAVKFSLPNPQITISSQCENGYVQYAVTDNGRGISPENIEHVFEWGYRHGPLFGFGIGLPVARYLVRRMHGDIRIDSRIGVGTTILILLPESPRLKTGLL